jgi:kinesin family protein 3/17
MLAQEQRRILEEKIKNMDSQMIVGGRKIEDTLEFKSALEKEAMLIRQEYEERINWEIEKERE